MPDDAPSFWKGVKNTFFGKDAPKPRFSNEEFDALLQSRSQTFVTKFNQIFDISSYPSEWQQIARAGLSNLIAGVSFFYGDTIQRTPDGSLRHTHEGSLLTAIPGRSYFPRGFLWDEGFHQLVVARWNRSLSEAILSSWLGRMEPSGYIEREQILGEEARAQVPAEFIPQNPNIANPPTLFLAVDFLAGWSSQTIEIDASGMAKEPSISDASLWKWLSYLMSSQASELESSFRWFGRTERHCLASGFDDYPRHRIISDKESHVDLLAWIVYALDVVDRHHLGVGDEPRSLLNRLRPYLLEKHWDASKHCFGDLGVIRQSEGKDEIGFETHVGYVSILPFALMLMDVDDPRIPEILDIIEDPNQLWSEYGLRSLAKNDEFFGVDEDYWRGNVWVNINYLVLRALHEKYGKEGPAAERCMRVYSALRENLVRNVMEQYKKTGFYWENYNSNTGEGRGVHPFNGWTTLVVLIMSERY